MQKSGNKSIAAVIAFWIQWVLIAVAGAHLVMVLTHPEAVSQLGRLTERMQFYLVNYFEPMRFVMGAMPLGMGTALCAVIAVILTIAARLSRKQPETLAEPVAVGFSSTSVVSTGDAPSRRETLGGWAAWIGCAGLGFAGAIVPMGLLSVQSVLQTRPGAVNVDDLADGMVMLAGGTTVAMILGLAALTIVCLGVGIRAFRNKGWMLVLPATLIVGGLSLNIRWLLMFH